ncbi:hypothetical protein [Streptomyces formicae]|uniref:Uncharacterized protein n=1 Tax=Streptomyces formicae TaxID=1616117 RepID=A0A291Q4H8_9ACTN|nr:hypothetical protein [Streptomyces formicae]ATL26512.1 hypothetical protein KY5_1494 [Streptomyces formicae]
MSTTPQMSQLGQQGQQYGQQGPSTAPPQQFGQQQGQQPFGQQGFGQRQPFGPPSIQGQQGIQGRQGFQGQQGIQQVPQHVQQQLQQLGQQQPFQGLLQQMGTEQIPQTQAPQVSTQNVTSGVATAFWDVVQPLPGQSPLLYLLIDGSWRVSVDPLDSTHDEVQEAFAYGQTVYGYYDTGNPGLLLSIVVTS